MTPKTLDQHIQTTPGICGGKPRIAGHRITVQQIVIWHDRMGRSADEIATEYDLELSDVYAALAFYFDHREDMDNAIESSSNWVEKAMQEAPSLVKRKLQQGSTDDGD